MNINYIGYYKLAPKRSFKHYALLALIGLEYIFLVDQLLKYNGL